MKLSVYENDSRPSCVFVKKQPLNDGGREHGVKLNGYENGRRPRCVFVKNNRANAGVVNTGTTLNMCSGRLPSCGFVEKPPRNM